ncbi:PIH1 domain-containing protein 1 [Gonapodya sp. JEL0774]|nr:PIH1 domain-containing protein 1 [Gonapodya sp. JEL0774]
MSTDLLTHLKNLALHSSDDPNGDGGDGDNLDAATLASLQQLQQELAGFSDEQVEAMLRGTDLAGLLGGLGKGGSGMGKDRTTPEKYEIVPKPAFVVKTHLAEKTEEYPADLKLFINLCHHASLPAPTPLSDDEFETALAQEDTDKLKVAMSLNEARGEVDKASRPCLVLDACVHTSHIASCERNPDYRHFLIECVLGMVETRNKWKVARDYSLPKLRSKGPLRPHFIARAPRPVIEETLLDTTKSHPAASKPKVPTTATPIQAKVRQPTYRIVCEPPEGRPEYMVVEIDLPGVPSTSTTSTTLDLTPTHLALDVPGLYSLLAPLPWPADTEDSDEAGGAEFDRGRGVCTVTVRVLGVDEV